jgi:ribonuclease HI
VKCVTIYSDGSAIKSKGGGFHGGAGAVLIYNGKEKHLSIPVPNGTNNISELSASLFALQHLKEPCKVTVITDSQYVIKCMTEWITGWKKKGWKTQKGDVKNKGLIQALDTECSRHDVSWKWVKGHNGDKYNTLADELAVKASTSLRIKEEG